MKQPKVIYLKIEKDLKMFISEWLIFLIGMGFIALLFIPILNIISNYPDDGMKLGLMIIFIFALTKIVYWVRIPTEYKTSDIVEEIRLELGDRK